MLERLQGALNDLVVFLESHENQPWPPVLGAFQRRVAEIDGSHGFPADLVRDFDRLFGGMGSLNDLTIYRANGHKVDDESQANLQLRRLVGNLFEEYQKIRWQVRQ